MTHYDVSCIMPVRNEGERVRVAIDSVLEATALTNYKVELIVLDDASTDNTLKVLEESAKKWRSLIKIVPLSERIGQVRAVNIGLRLARGEFIGMLGGDDLWFPEGLVARVQALREDPKIGLVFGWPKFINEAFNEITPPSSYDNDFYRPVNKGREAWLRTLSEGNPFFAQTMLARRELFDYCGLFDEELLQLADLDWYMRAFRRYDVRVLERPVAKVCARESGTGAPTPENVVKAQKELARIREKWNGRDTKPQGIGYKGKLVIATPFYEVKGYSPYIASLIKTITVLERLGVDWDWWEISGDSYIDRAKNSLCQMALDDPSVTDLLLIDSDHSWGTMGVIKAILSPELVVGGAYPTKNAWDSWSSIFVSDENGRPMGKVIDGTVHVEASLVSGGFLRLKREALEKFAAAYPELQYVDRDVSGKGGKLFTAFFARWHEGLVVHGEDGAFCKRWLALGEKLWIIPDIDFGHFGVKGWYGNLDDYLRKLPGGDRAEAA